MSSSIEQAKDETRSKGSTQVSQLPEDRSRSIDQDDPVGVADPNSADQGVTLRGRSVFVVQTSAAGVMVRTAWLGEDNNLMDMPAVFPDMLYALNVLDDLRQQVIQHFSQAAQVGAQVIANQLREQQQIQSQTQSQTQGQTQGQTQTEPNTGHKAGQELALETQGKA